MCTVHATIFIKAIICSKLNYLSRRTCAFASSSPNAAFMMYILQDVHCDSVCERCVIVVNAPWLFVPSSFVLTLTNNFLYNGTRSSPNSADGKVDNWHCSTTVSIRVSQPGFVLTLWYAPVLVDLILSVTFANFGQPPQISDNRVVAWNDVPSFAKSLRVPWLPDCPISSPVGVHGQVPLDRSHSFLGPAVGTLTNGPAWPRFAAKVIACSRLTPRAKPVCWRWRCVRSSHNWSRSLHTKQNLSIHHFRVPRAAQPARANNAWAGCWSKWEDRGGVVIWWKMCWHLGRVIHNTWYARQPAQYVNTSIRSTLVCQYALPFRGPYTLLTSQASAEPLWPEKLFWSKRTKKKRKNYTSEDAIGATRLSGFWSSGRWGRWQRNSYTHSAGHGVQCKRCCGWVQDKSVLANEPGVCSGLRRSNRLHNVVPAHCALRGLVPTKASSRVSTLQLLLEGSCWRICQARVALAW